MAGRWKMVSALLLFVPVAACGIGGEGDASGSMGPQALEITSPNQGAKVSVPFTVELSSEVPLGRPGRQNYVRVSFNGVETRIVTDERFKVTKGVVPPGPGPLAIDVALYNSDGEWLGSSDEIEVNVPRRSG